MTILTRAAIQLSSGDKTFVDAKDFDFLNRYKWQLNKNPHKKAYVDRRISEGKKRWRIFLHHAVIGYPLHGLQIDHIDGNGLNNTRENLRIVTPRENCANNKTKINKTSKYIGVYWYRKFKKWSADIWVNHKKEFLGYYDNEIDAHLAYQEYVKKLREKVNKKCRKEKYK